MLECHTKNSRIEQLELRISELECQLEELQRPKAVNGTESETTEEEALVEGDGDGDKIISSSISVSVVEADDGEQEEGGCVVANVPRAITPSAPE